LRFGTGDPRGSVGQGQGPVRPSGQIVEIGKRHPELRSVRLVVRRESEQDAMTLHAETASPSETLKRSR
jgi:phenylacetate-CoA ligase